MTWIQTRHGRAVNLEGPMVDSIELDDIAWHLANIQRFTGATMGWSVAQHSLLVCRLIERWANETNYQPQPGDWTDPATCSALDLAAAGLFHDAAEAYVGDVSAPLKQLIRFRTGSRRSVLDEIEQGVMGAIRARFGGLRGLDHPIVKRADLWALAIEKRTFFDKEALPWDPIDETDSPGAGMALGDGLPGVATFALFGGCGRLKFIEKAKALLHEMLA